MAALQPLGFSSALGIMSICAGVLLIGGVAISHIAGAPSRKTTKQLPDGSLPYRAIASILHGGISIFLFWVVIAVVMGQANRTVGEQPWEWGVIAVLLASVAAAGVFFAVLAWGGLGDPRLRFGDWAQKMYSAETVQGFLLEIAAGVFMLFVHWLFGIK